MAESDQRQSHTARTLRESGQPKQTRGRPPGAAEGENKSNKLTNVWQVHFCKMKRKYWCFLNVQILVISQAFTISQASFSTNSSNLSSFYDLSSNIAAEELNRCSG